MIERFLRKYLRASSLTVFAKNFIIYVSEGCNYASLAVSFSCTVNKDTVNEDKLFLGISFLKILQISVENTCVAGPQACNFIKKRLQHKCFPVNFLRTPFSREQLQWLLFKIRNSNDL